MDMRLDADLAVLSACDTPVAAHTEMTKKKPEAKRQMDWVKDWSGFRKGKGLTLQALELINVHVIQLRRYESGVSLPTLDVIRRLTVALQVSADELILGTTFLSTSIPGRADRSKVGR